MSGFLKQATAVTIKLGPFVDSTDGKTAETGLTITKADVRLSKNGAAFVEKSQADSATHDENGYYAVSLDASDTGTPGRLRVAVSESGALPVWDDFMVVPALVYDSIIAGTDALMVETTSYTAGALTSAAFAANAIDAAALADGAITASTFAAGAVTSIALATDAIDADALATDAVSEITAAIKALELTTPTAAPTAPYTVDDVLGWLLAVSKFRRAQTATLETLYRDNSSTSLATSVKADNGTTFNRYEYE